MNNLWDIRIFMGLVPKESPCTWWEVQITNLVIITLLQSPVSSAIWAYIYSWTLYSQKPSTYIPGSVSETKLHTHTNNMNSYGSVHFNLHIFGKQNARQRILGRMVAGIPWVQSLLSFFLEERLIWQGTYQEIGLNVVTLATTIWWPQNEAIAYRFKFYPDVNFTFIITTNS